MSVKVKSMKTNSISDIQKVEEVEITDSFPLMIFKVSLVVTILLIFLVKPFAAFVARAMVQM